MLNNMIAYTVATLSAVADLLISEPIIYLVSLIGLCIIAKFIKILIKS